MKKMAFVYLSNYKDWPLGGMLNYAKNLLPYIIENYNWDVDIWGGEVINSKVFDSKIKIYTKIKTSKKIVPNFIRSFLGIICHRKDFAEYDIVYSHTSATTIAMKICYPNKFVVHHQHGLSYKDAKGFIKILNIGYTLAQILANVSFFVASEEEVIQHSKHRIFTNKHFYSIGSPINFEYISNKKKGNINKNNKRFIYTGRIDEWKNIEFLIRAFQKYHKEFQNSELYIIGDGPEFEKIKNIIISDNSDFIYLTGRLGHDSIVEYLAGSDVFLFPSKGEGVSLSVLEALSAGLPVVGFDVMGVRNLVVDEKTGILVKEMNIEAFVVGMKKAYDMKELLKESCKQFASNYSTIKIEEKISNIISKEYRSFINEKNYH